MVGKSNETEMLKGDNNVDNNEETAANNHFKEIDKTTVTLTKQTIPKRNYKLERK